MMIEKLINLNGTNHKNMSFCFFDKLPTEPDKKNCQYKEECKNIKKMYAVPLLKILRDFNIKRDSLFGGKSVGKYTGVCAANSLIRFIREFGINTSQYNSFVYGIKNEVDILILKDGVDNTRLSDEPYELDQVLGFIEMKSNGLFFNPNIDHNYEDTIRREILPLYDIASMHNKKYFAVSFNEDYKKWKPLIKKVNLELEYFILNQTNNYNQISYNRDLCIMEKECDNYRSLYIKDYYDFVKMILSFKE